MIELIQKNDVDAVREAVAKDPAILALRAPDGSSMIRQAIYHQRAEIARVLVELGAPVDFYDACALGDLAVANAFLEKDASFANSFAEDGFQGLGLAVFFGHRDVAIRLLARGARATEVSRNAIRVTPLHSAAAVGDSVMAAVLLSHGADPDARGTFGGTPLHTAAGVGNLELVKLLLRHGGEVDARTDAGETVVDLARKYGRDDVVEWLTPRLP